MGYQIPCKFSGCWLGCFKGHATAKLAHCIQEVSFVDISKKALKAIVAKLRQQAQCLGAPMQEHAALSPSSQQLAGADDTAGPSSSTTAEPAVKVSDANQKVLTLFGTAKACKAAQQAIEQQLQVSAP